jgi:hypothetical protein
MGSLAGVWGYGRSRDLRLPRRHGNANAKYPDDAACRHHSGADGGDADYAASHDEHPEYGARHTDGGRGYADRSRSVPV